MPMEEDLYSNGRKVSTPPAGTWQGPGDDWSERVEDIYDSIDAQVTGPTAQQQEPTAQSTKTSEPHTERHLHLAYLSIGLLCILQALLNITLRVSWNESRDPTETSFPNLTHLTVTGQNAELQITLGNVVEERNHLQTAYNTSLKQQDALRKTLHGNLCTCWQNTICSCYYFSDSSKNWQESRADCRERGSDLIVVNSKEEQDFVPSGFWLGVTDAEEEGTWKWVDGTPLTTEYWGPSQPDNFEKNPSIEEDCVERSGKYGWNDVSCLNDLFWICEKNLDVSALCDLHV